MTNFFYPGDIEEIISALGQKAYEFEGKNILMAGGTGFLGRYFSETFRVLNQKHFKKPCKLIIVDNLRTSPKPTWTNDSHIQFLEHDITKPMKMPEKIDFIIQAAGIASPYYYRAFPLETLDVAVNGTRYLLEVATEHKAKFLFFSSSEIYGDPDSKNVPTQESYRGNVSCLGPRACYDESKRLGETLCRIFTTKHCTETKIVRPFNVFGPGMQELDYRVLPNFASRIASKKPLMVYGDGHQTRTFCYITDAINGFLRVLLDGLPGEPYNVGNPTPEVSMNDLTAAVQDVVGSKVSVERVSYPDSYPADEPMRRCPDITKARIQVGYEPRIEFKEGLGRFFRWAAENYTGKQ